MKRHRSAPFKTAGRFLAATGKPVKLIGRLRWQTLWGNLQQERDLLGTWLAPRPSSPDGEPSFKEDEGQDSLLAGDDLQHILLLKGAPKLEMYYFL